MEGHETYMIYKRRPSLINTLKHWRLQETEKSVLHNNLDKKVTLKELMSSDHRGTGAESVMEIKLLLYKTSLVHDLHRGNNVWLYHCGWGAKQMLRGDGNNSEVRFSIFFPFWCTYFITLNIQVFYMHVCMCTMCHPWCLRRTERSGT